MQSNFSRCRFNHKNHSGQKIFRPLAEPALRKLPLQSGLVQYEQMISYRPAKNSAPIALSGAEVGPFVFSLAAAAQGKSGMGSKTASLPAS
jgi:hypothetical protein